MIDDAHDPEIDPDFDPTHPANTPEFWEYLNTLDLTHDERSLIQYLYSQLSEDAFDALDSANDETIARFLGILDQNNYGVRAYREPTVDEVTEQLRLLVPTDSGSELSEDELHTIAQHIFEYYPDQPVNLDLLEQATTDLMR